MKHGMWKSPEFRVWLGMNDRCYNPNCKKFHLYGGRGIKISKRWRSFANFYADMGPRPSASHQIDRIDNDKGYERGNCRWATRKEQIRNRRTTRYVSVRGERRSLPEWCEIFGQRTETVRMRLSRGWTPEQAMKLESRP